MIVKGGFVHVAFALIKRITIVPKYNIEKLYKASKGTSKIKLVRTVIGTVKRIIKGSI